MEELEKILSREEQARIDLALVASLYYANACWALHNLDKINTWTTREFAEGNTRIRKELGLEYVAVAINPTKFPYVGRDELDWVNGRIRSLIENMPNLTEEFSDGKTKCPYEIPLEILDKYELKDMKSSSPAPNQNSPAITFKNRVHTSDASRGSEFAPRAHT